MNFDFVSMNECLHELYTTDHMHRGIVVIVIHTCARARKHTQTYSHNIPSTGQTYFLGYPCALAFDVRAEPLARIPVWAAAAGHAGACTEKERRTASTHVWMRCLVVCNDRDAKETRRR